jgi:DNA polymerase III sliding clamp (beta) subunit (PCNA family)
MTIQTTRAVLLDALTEVVGASSPKHTLAILDGVRVTPTPGALALCCTDMMVTANASLPCEHGGESFVVVANTFRKAVDSMPEGPLTQALDKAHLVIKAGRATTKLPFRDAADFPATQSTPAPTVHVKASTLRRVLNASRHAAEVGAQQSPTRDGTYLTMERGKVQATTTDGKVVARAWDSCGDGKPLAALIPSAGCAAIVRALDRYGDDEVPVAIADSVLFVGQMSARLYDEAPLPADVIFSKSRGEHAIVLPRTELVAALRRATVTAPNAKVKIICRDAGTVFVAAESAAGDTGTEIEGQMPGEMTTIATAANLLDQLEHVPDDEVRIVMNATNGLAPMLFESTGYMGVVMPMRF